jgi:hypothetical protein
MAKKAEGKGSEKIKGKPAPASPSRPKTITVIRGERTSHDELMKLPKAQIVRNMAIPENRVRYLIDVDDRTKQGTRIIALMDKLCDNDANALTTVSEILGALANMVAKSAAPGK